MKDMTDQSLLPRASGGEGGRRPDEGAPHPALRATLSPLRGARAEEFDAVADLLRYPSDMKARVARALTELAGRAEALNHVIDFWDEVGHVTPDGLEELYTMTFDLNPVATLEVGWHVWGEQYERGRFLADLRPLQAENGIDAGSELPDHLTVMLPFLGRLEPIEAAPFIEHVEKAAGKILEPLDRNGNPYRHLIRAALATLHGGRA